MVARYARLVVLSHSVFALPFALWGFALGIQDVSRIEWLTPLLWVLVAVVSARTAAMAFNRYVDRHLDAENPRTAGRELPRGEVKPREALFLTIGAAGIFVIAAWQLNALCGALSPVALIVLLGYSYTKRFTALSHYVLGIALGLAPIGAYIAITGRFSLPIIGIGVAVTCWVGGFDILYALQDLSFDRAKGLHSLPAALGEPTARRIALLSHLVAISILAGIGAVFYKSERASLLYWIGWTLFSGFVLRQHWISRDIARINRTFFTHNGIASVLFGTCAIAGLLLL